MESNNRARLSSFLNNRRALIIISVLLAVITWLAISINESPEVERTVKGFAFRWMRVSRASWGIRRSAPTI